MKKQVSVFGLHARAALNRLLPVVLGLLVVEGIFAGLCIAHGAALTLSGSNLESALHYSFRAGILALQVLLASSLGSNSRYGYTPVSYTHLDVYKRQTLAFLTGSS